jgi:hypothetical protein
MANHKDVGREDREYADDQGDGGARLDGDTLKPSKQVVFHD